MRTKLNYAAFLLTSSRWDEKKRCCPTRDGFFRCLFLISVFSSFKLVFLFFSPLLSRIVDTHSLSHTHPFVDTFCIFCELWVSLEKRSLNKKSKILVAKKWGFRTRFVFKHEYFLIRHWMCECLYCIFYPFNHRLI